MIHPREGGRPCEAVSVLLSWCECAHCRGRFAHPVPSVSTIRSLWGAVTYVDLSAGVVAYAQEMAMRESLEAPDGFDPGNEGDLRT
jgi:hypothetical protein